MNNVIKVHSQDNVAVAIVDLSAGSIVNAGENDILLKNDIGAGHKFALVNIKESQDITKYGFRIGVAKADIACGEFVHDHNVKTALSGGFTAEPELVEACHDRYPELESKTFSGYQRKDGSVGIRNELWIIPTVGCVNASARKIARDVNDALNIDGVDGCYAFEHPYGCSQLGDDHERTKEVLAGLVAHPNAGGVLVLGLGCENNQIADFKELLGDYDQERVRFLVTQEVEDEEEEAKKILGELAEYAASCKPQLQPVSKLKIGLKCGGSDAFSGLSANPLLGKLSEMLVGAGGYVALTEIPEIFGAENEFLPRCDSREVCDKAVKLINNFRDYFTAHGEPVSENPSPGNRKGGITTLEEKSLGCVQKGGRVPIVDVLDYGEKINKHGLSVLNGPGNDIVAVTNLAAAGAHMIFFTTGRGTPLGAPVPCVKVATNSELARRKSKWIDFDAGVILTGKSMEDTAKDLFAKLLAVASHDCETKSEENDFRDVSIFKSGVTL